jgi:formate hydrogenlyase transcriptional activator
MAARSARHWTRAHSANLELGELRAEPGREENVTLRYTDRERILRALRECSGQLGGPNGAAARLGLKRTALQSKLNAFGIDPGGYRA